MIISQKPLSLAEAKEIVETADKEEEKKEIRGFFKKFTKISLKDALALREELSGLGILKLKDEVIVKIVDLLPRDASDLNKILTESSLDAEETNKVLEVVKKYG